MKNYLKYVLGIIAAIVFLSSSSKIFACEIDFSVVGTKKATYNVGDEIVIKVEVTFTHRNCPEGIEKTKFKTNGLKVIGKTKWEETSPGVFIRKLKVKVTGSKKGKVSINAVRTCDKEGGFGSLTLKAEPVK